MAKVPVPGTKDGTEEMVIRKRRKYKPRGASLRRIPGITHISGDPWLPQYKESGPAFEAFQYFRDLGPERVLKVVAEDIGKSYGLINRWAAEWRWWDRARAWDAHLLKQESEAFAEETRRMAKRQASLGMRMQAVAERKLKIIEDSPEELIALEPSDAIRMAVEGSKIERAARGEEKSSQNITFVFNGPPPKWAPKAVAAAATILPAEHGEGESPVYNNLPVLEGHVDGN